MAGIGFELKKLFKDKGLLFSFRGYLYSIFVTIGPTVISIIVITLLQLILKGVGIPAKDRELLQAIIMYSFIFSVILSSGYGMLLSRYLADRLYMNEKKDILPSLYGSLSVMLILAGIIGFLFYVQASLPTPYKFLAYLLFIQLNIHMVLNIYVSALKNYKKIAFSFLWGTIIALIVGYVLLKYRMTDVVLGVLISFNLCIFIVLILLIREITAYFKVKSNLYFDFIKYFDGYLLIFLTNFCYMFGLYIHNFIFWTNGKMNYVIEDTFIYAPNYDLPVFYAFLSILPTMVIFVVKVETAFYEKYRNYFYLVNNGACHEDIEVAKKEMKKVVFKELIYIMEIQLFFSIAFILVGTKLLKYIGFTSQMIDIYNIVILAYYCAIMMFVIMTILLYYDNKRSAFIIAFIFLVTNGLFTWISIQLGQGYYGLGFFCSAMLSLIIAIIRLYHYMENIDYYVFCIQVAWGEKEKGTLATIVDRINKIGG